MRLKKEIGRINNLIRQNYEDNLHFNEDVILLLKKFPELRNILYEIIAEFVLFFQDDEIVRKFREEKKEIFNLYHKQIITYR